MAYHTLPPLLKLKVQEIIRDYTPVSTLKALNRGVTEVATLIRDYLYHQFEL